MAKISNTTAYPNQSPVSLSDYLIGTDAATLSTKTFTVQDLADAIDDTVTLQEVLQTGSTATGNTGNGQVVITAGCETTPPTATNPAPIAVQCPGDVPAPNVNVVTDEADNCGVGEATFSDAVDATDPCNMYCSYIVNINPYW